MVSLKEVERQLKQLGVTFPYWGRSELRELPRILIPHEQIIACINGRYEGGFAMLCATNHRLLLIDKKPFFLTLEDIRYDTISEVDYNYRLLESTVRINTPTKPFMFMSWRQADLRKLTVLVQQRVVELHRQQENKPFEQQFQTMNMQQYSAPALPDSPQPQPQQPDAIDNDGDRALDKVERAFPLPNFNNPYVNNTLLMRRRPSRYVQPNP